MRLPGLPLYVLGVTAAPLLEAEEAPNHHWSSVVGGVFRSAKWLGWVSSRLRPRPPGVQPRAWPRLPETETPPLREESLTGEECLSDPHLGRDLLKGLSLHLLPPGRDRESLCHGWRGWPSRRHPASRCHGVRTDRLCQQTSWPRCASSAGSMGVGQPWGTGTWTDGLRPDLETVQGWGGGKAQTNRPFEALTLHGCWGGGARTGRFHGYVCLAQT